jgi:hypothetical protein
MPLKTLRKLGRAIERIRSFDNKGCSVELRAWLQWEEEKLFNQLRAAVDIANRFGA